MHSLTQVEQLQLLLSPFLLEHPENLCLLICRTDFGATTDILANNTVNRCCIKTVTDRLKKTEAS